MNSITDFIRMVGKNGLNFLEYFGDLLCHVARSANLIFDTFSQAKYTHKMLPQIIKEMRISGIGSIPLVITASAFVGGETVIQSEFQFHGIVPMRYLGMAVCKSLLSELCPVIVSFIVSSRMSTSFAAEIGTMKTSEQLDAMKCMNLEPVRYLVVPKFYSCIIMLPVLVIFGELVAFGSSIITALLFIDVTFTQYVQGFRLFFSLTDLVSGIIKSSVFGAIICFVGVYEGFQTSGGATGVGKSTTNAVVISALLILAADFFVGYLLK